MWGKGENLGLLYGAFVAGQQHLVFEILPGLWGAQ
jgi:hypothetical protein